MITSFSDRGDRDYSHDYSLSGIIKHKRKKYSYTIVCDGVGSKDGTGIIAKHVALESEKGIKKWLKKQKRMCLFNSNNQSPLATYLESFLENNINLSISGYSTLAISLRQCDKVLCIWAGDSRVYIINSNTELIQLTKDHQDKGGKLSSFIANDGFSPEICQSKVSCLKNQKLVAVITTSDGVHNFCKQDELNSFLTYVLFQGQIGSKELKAHTLRFLGKNIDDNLSMGIDINEKQRKKFQLNWRAKYA